MLIISNYYSIIIVIDTKTTYVHFTYVDMDAHFMVYNN